MDTIAEVKIWDKLIGAVAFYDNMGVVFEYDKGFLKYDLDLAPLMMPVSFIATNSPRFSFNNLPKETFDGLPGILADSLPDKFGHAIINQWLLSIGRDLGSFNAVERLCYTGQR